MFTPTVKLFYLEGSNPRDYELEISIDTRTTSGLKLSNCEEIPDAPYTDLKYLIKVGLGTDDAHLTTMRVPLGKMNLDPDDGEIEINLIDSSFKIKGKGRVRAEEAQQESRPIEEF